jgi:hypothetical protein
MIQLENEKETIKNAVFGDGAALARVCKYLQSIVINYSKHSTREIAENHAKIEAKRLSIIAIAFAKKEQITAFDILQNEMINQIETK